MIYEGNEKYTVHLEQGDVVMSKQEIIDTYDELLEKERDRGFEENVIKEISGEFYDSIYFSVKCNTRNEVEDASLEQRDVDEDRLTNLIMDDVTNRLEETLRAYFNSGTRIVKMG